MNVGVLGDVEFDRDAPGVRDGNRGWVAGTGVDFRGTRREECVRVGFSEATVRTCHERNRDVSFLWAGDIAIQRPARPSVCSEDPVLIWSDLSIPFRGADGLIV